MNFSAPRGRPPKGADVPVSLPRGESARFRSEPDGFGYHLTSVRSDVHILQAVGTHWPASGNIVIVEDDDGVTLIDCGLGGEPAKVSLAASLQAMGYGLDAIHTVLITHPHIDHMGGLAFVTPATRIFGSVEIASAASGEAAMAELIFPTSVRDMAPARAGVDIVEHLREDCGAQKLDISVTALEDRQIVQVGRTRWVAVDTPGHEKGMFSYFEPDLGILVCSDLLLSPGTSIPWYTPEGGGTSAYLQSLACLKEFEISLAVRGHGLPVHGRDEVTTVIQETRARIEGRNETVAAALSELPLTFAELEQQIYPSYVYDVIPWASTVLATHLHEGIQSGQLRQHGEKFEAITQVGGAR